MHCEHCQIEYPEGKKFCRQCGESLKPRAAAPPGVAALCPNCEAQVPSNAKFCGSCGISLVGPTPVSFARVQTTAQPTSKQIDAAVLEEAVSQQRKKVLKAAGIGIGGLGLLGVVIAGGLFVYRAFVTSPASLQEKTPQQVVQGGEEAPPFPPNKPMPGPEEKHEKEPMGNVPSPAGEDGKQQPESNASRGAEKPASVPSPPTQTFVGIDSLEEDLNRTVPTVAPSRENFCAGAFRVESIPDPTEQQPAATISFRMDGKELFKETVRTYDGESHEFAVVHFQGCSGLLSTTLSGAGGGQTSSALIVPYQRTFKTLQLEDWAMPDGIKDLDGDGGDELLVQKLVLGYDCVAGAYRQYWTTIYHYDSLQGRLVEVSDQFPQFYATRVKDYRKALQEFQRSSPLSPRCRKEMQSLIAKAQRYTATSNTTRTATTATAVPSFSPGWYETIRPTSVLEEPRRHAAVIIRLSPNTRVHVVGSEKDYARVTSASGKPPGYIARKDIVPAQEGNEATEREEQRSREEERQQRLQAQEEAGRQAEVARQAEIQRREEERQQQQEWQQQQELLRSGERILQGLGH